MSKRDDIDLLYDIQEAIRTILSYSSEFTFNQFLKDRQTKDAVIRNFEIIGEASKSASEKLKTRYKDIEWKEMARFRDKLLHHYFGIDYALVWDVIRDILPSMIIQINEAILKESKGDRA